MSRVSRPSWVYTAWVAMVLVVLVTPLWAVLLLLRDGPLAQRLVQRCARWVVWFTGCPVRVTGAERLQQTGPRMLVANHASLADAAVLLSALPIEFAFVANHVFAGYPVIGLAIRRASHHIVDRDSWRGRAECGTAMVDGLRAGHSLLVFPEGRTSGGALHPFRNGAFRAAVQAGCPIVPIAIRGTRDVFPASYRLCRGSIDIEILPAIVPGDDTREAVRAVRDAAAASIAAALQGRRP
jgi:1-acyl-sn-glycerol-3-phosphate acyltransferase